MNGGLRAGLVLRTGRAFSVRAGVPGAYDLARKKFNPCYVRWNFLLGTLLTTREWALHVHDDIAKRKHVGGRLVRQDAPLRWVHHLPPVLHANQASGAPLITVVRQRVPKPRSPKEVERLR